MSGNVLDPDHARVDPTRVDPTRVDPTRLAPALDRKPEAPIAGRRERRSRRPDENRHREEVIREVLTREGERLSQEVIRKLTSDLGVSRATAYRMIKTFRSCGAVTAPMTRPVGRPKGARVLDSARETLIRDAIETFYLQPSRPKFSQLVREIAKRCLKERLPAPNWRTIKARVHDIDIQTRTRRRSETE